MILDSLNNTKKIECLHPLFKKAFDYLKSTDFSKVEDGKHELDGSRLYVSVVSIFGKEKKDAKDKEVVMVCEYIEKGDYYIYYPEQCMAQNDNNLVFLSENGIKIEAFFQ